MNRKHMTLAIAAIVAAVSMTGVAFVVPQQAGVRTSPTPQQYLKS